MNIKACIFDLDGVVVDTARYHFLSWIKLADEFGFEIPPEIEEQLKGISRMASMDIVLKAGNITKTHEEKVALAVKKNDWYLDSIKDMTIDEVLPGVIDFLEDLQKNNIKIALGSASKNASAILKQVDISHYFEVIVDGNHVKNSKPDPEVFLNGAHGLGVNPEETIVFEDSTKGIDAAITAGFLPVGIGLPQNLKKAIIVEPGFKDLTFKKLIDKLQKAQD